MACVGAASTGHLCKSMIMENTRAHSSVEGWSNPLNSRYYVVIVQYTARLHPDKIKNFVHKLSGGLVRSVGVAWDWGNWARQCPPDSCHVLNTLPFPLQQLFLPPSPLPPPVCTRLASSSSTCG